MLGVTETVRVEVDPGTVLLGVEDAKASSFCMIEGKRAQVHSRAERQVSTIKAMIHRCKSYRLRDCIWCDGGGAWLSSNMLVDGVKGRKGDIVKINCHRC